MYIRRKQRIYSLANMNCLDKKDGVDHEGKPFHCLRIHYNLWKADPDETDCEQIHMRFLTSKDRDLAFELISDKIGGSETRMLYLDDDELKERLNDQS